MFRLLGALLVLLLTASPSAAICGDGNIDLLEQCDDGNTTSNDGCSALCLLEGCPLTGSWSGAPSGLAYAWNLVENTGVVTGVAYPAGAPGFGNYAVTGTRVGPAVTLIAGGLPYVGLMVTCNRIHVAALAFDIVRTRPTYCGDGIVQSPDETCDDGNFLNGDGCTVACTEAPSMCGNGVVDSGEACDDGNANDTDGCLTGCIPAACGDGHVRFGVETCDDGGTASGDGCSADCTLELESVTSAIGGLLRTITTDTESGDGATAADPTEATLTAPLGTLSGTLSLIETSTPPPHEPGYLALGNLIEVSALDLDPAPTALAPLTLSFRVDATLLGPGQDESIIRIRKDGIVVAPCEGPAGVAQPDPCIATRERFGDGDAGITVLTSTASEWDMSASVCGREPSLGCQPAMVNKTKLKIKNRFDRDVLAWSWRNGVGTSSAMLADPTDTTDYTLCLYDADGAVLQLSVPAGGTCNTRPCWTSTPSGYKYKNKELVPDGISKLQLKSGGAGYGKIASKAIGPLAPAALPLALPARLQLRNSDGTCFESRFDGAVANEVERFRAVGY